MMNSDLFLYPRFLSRIIWSTSSKSSLGILIVVYLWELFSSEGNETPLSHI